MTTHKLHILNSTLLALPAALVLTRRLMLSYKTPALVGNGSVNEKTKGSRQHTSVLMERLKRITGHSHYGLNE